MVDDEPQVRSLLKKCLRSAGFGVVEADCGLRALALIEQNTIGAVDVLVTDIEMPHMDGITLAERCKRSFPNLRVVVISGFTNKVIPEIGTTVDAFVQKPFVPKALLATIAKVLQNGSPGHMNAG